MKTCKHVGFVKLAKGVENGTVKTEDDLKHGFAKNGHGLAKAWHGVAGDAKAAGKDTRPRP